MNAINVMIVKIDGDLVVSLSEPLYFREWPYHSSSHSNKKIDILAEIKETIRPADGLCVRSTLRLNYFLIADDKRLACESIRYDFHTFVQDRHPVCHAQHMNSTIDPPELFKFDIDVERLGKRHQSIRIPTAFVNLSGLFAKLTADHLPGETVSEFWKECQPYIDDIPMHASNQEFEKIFSDANLRSHSWYKW